MALSKQRLINGLLTRDPPPPEELRNYRGTSGNH